MTAHHAAAVPSSPPLLQAVHLALQCLSFDFVGTCLDESSEDLGTIQVPSGGWAAAPQAGNSGRPAAGCGCSCCSYASPIGRLERHLTSLPLPLSLLPSLPTAAWRPSIEDPSTLKLFTDFYAATQPPLSNMALECLVGGAGGVCGWAGGCHCCRGADQGAAAGCTSCLCVWHLQRWLQYTPRVAGLRQRSPLLAGSTADTAAPKMPTTFAWSAPLTVQVRLASVRRSLFSSESERSNFLSRLVNGTRDLLRQQAGLAHHANYHEFCRLLGRLKANYQLSELVGTSLPLAAP